MNGMPSKWGTIRAVSATASGGLVVGFTVAEVSGAGAVVLACFLGLFPVVFFLLGSQLARGVLTATAVVILAGYTAFWIYGTLDYGNYMLGGLYFFFIPLLGMVALAPVLAGHWLVYIWREWRRGSMVDRPS
jgi:hypothetical protein